MANKTVTKETTKGICNFCKGEFEKAKMTQHLRYCKQRAAEIAAEAASSTASQKTTLFHIVAEGLYNPQYWMHIELPASDALIDLDGFLRGVWVECCGHLSGFKIGEVFYSSEPEDYFYFGSEEEYVENDVETEDEEEETVEELLERLPPVLLETVPTDLLNKVKEFRSVYDVVPFLRAEQKSIKYGDNPRTREEWEEARARWARKDAIKWLLDVLEDRSLYVPLEKALKTGQKFFYEYDFGSTTHLALRVVSEREGIEEEDNIEILARNIPPTILCKVCGKPAKRVASGYYNVEEYAYCSSKCARKDHQYYEEMLPVVNSPRVGVCGYTGRD